MKKLFLIALITMVALTAAAQDSLRHITPVRPITNVTQPPPRGTDEETIKRYLTGDSAYLEEMRRDSLKRIYTHYPLLTDVSVGVNFIDPILMAMGQDYASVDVNATLNMWNRLQPALEIGLGFGKTTPEDKNFTYRAKPSIYGKVGFNYNFLFKSEPLYHAIVGLRLGYSSFKYDVTDVTYSNSYWNETVTYDSRGISSSALWGEVLAGIRVNIWRQWALGWTIRYHGLFNYKKSELGKPWFIPGYGPRGRSLAFTFSLSYTIPLYKTRLSEVDKNDSNQIKNRL